MDISNIYETLKARGLVRSRRQFAQCFLKRASSYAAGNGLGRCSPAALLNLYRALGESQQTDLQAAVFSQLIRVQTRSSSHEQVGQ